MLWGMLGVLLQVAAPPKEPESLRGARDAQVRFERVRRMNLPRERSSGSDPCTTRIGRFCYWYDSSEAQAVPEPPRIGEARKVLLVTLAQAARVNPADGWLAGQRVAYLTEAGRNAEALAVARACRADRWWCGALVGFALHVDERYEQADSAFAQALGALPPEQRCAWHDLRKQVPQPLAREFAAASCDQRIRIANALWDMSVPLFSAKGNDFRTEHFSRHTLALIRARAANAHGLAWGNDSRELLLRYGTAEWYARREARPGTLDDNGDVIGHDREPSYAFFPPIRSTRGVPWVAPDAWRLRASDAESRYAPRHLRRIVALPHQLTRFPRGDSMLVAVAVSVEDSALREDSVVVTLGAMDRRHRRTVVSGGRTLSLMLPNDSAIVSIEALGARTRRVAWARYSIEPIVCQPGLCVSGLMLTRGTDHPATIEAALRLALTGTAVRASQPLGVAWEVRASASPEPVRMTLTIEPMDVGLGRRLAARLGLSRLPAPVRLQWMARTDSSRVESTTLRLPPGARGKHRIQLRLDRGAQAAFASREVDVLP